MLEYMFEILSPCLCEAPQDQDTIFNNNLGKQEQLCITTVRAVRLASQETEFFFKPAIQRFLVVTRLEEGLCINLRDSDVPTLQ